MIGRLVILGTLVFMMGATRIQQNTWFPVIEAYECQGLWPEGETLVWNYPEVGSADKVCIEARFGDHYSWHTPWVRVICVDPTVTEVDPLLVTTTAYGTLVKFRAVAVNEYVDPECESLPHYCAEEAVSEPSNEVCGGQIMGQRRA